MNTVNRVIIVVLLLLVMAACSFTLVMPVRTLHFVAQQAEALSDAVGRISSVARLPLGILMASIVSLIGILFIILEVRRPASKGVTIQEAGGGEVTLSVGSVADQLKAELNGLPEVVQAKPMISAQRKGVAVEVDARIAADSGVPDAAERIVDTIRRLVEEEMGLKLARPPKVNIEAVHKAGAGRKTAGQSEPAPVESPGSMAVTDEESELS